MNRSLHEPCNTIPNKKTCFDFMSNKKESSDIWGVWPFKLSASTSPTSFLDAFPAWFSFGHYFKPPNKFSCFIIIIENCKHGSSMPQPPLYLHWHISCVLKKYVLKLFWILSPFMINFYKEHMHLWEVSVVVPPILPTPPLLSKTWFLVLDFNGVLVQCVHYPRVPTMPFYKPKDANYDAPPPRASKASSCTSGRSFSAPCRLPNQSGG